VTVVPPTFVPGTVISATSITMRSMAKLAWLASANRINVRYFTRRRL